MTTSMQQSPLMVLEYQWKPTSVNFTANSTLTQFEMTPNIAISKMIKFRDEEVFRVCIKQPVGYGPVYILFICSNINKLGIKVEGIDLTVFGIKKRMILKSNQTSCIQIFSHEIGNRELRISTARDSIKDNISFSIYISGCLSEYRFQLRDQLLKTQLWMAAQEQ